MSPHQPDSVSRAASASRPSTAHRGLGVGAGVVVVGLMVLTGCGGSSVGTGSGSGANPGPAASVSEGAGGVQVVNVRGTAQITFDPTRIVVHPGKVSVHFTVPPGSAPHSFTVAALGLDSGVFSNAEKTVNFTVNKPGTFTYTCDIHANMKGTLVVTQ